MDVSIMSRRRCREKQLRYLSSSSQTAGTCTGAGVARACGAAPLASFTQAACKPSVVMEGSTRCGGAHPMVLFGLSKAPLSPQIPYSSCDVEPTALVGHVERAFAIDDGAGTMSDETVAARDSMRSANARIPPFRALDP